MSIDKEVESAVYATVKELGQSEKVAKRLISWLLEMSEKEISTADNNEHFEFLKNAIRTEVSNGD